jgi:hypothetical protein
LEAIMRLVRVVAPHFVAGFETDGVVRRAAPILKRLVGETDEVARKVIERFKWKASVIDDDGPAVLQDLR